MQNITPPGMIHKYARMASLLNRLDEIQQSRRKMLKEYRKAAKTARTELDKTRATIRSAMPSPLDEREGREEGD